MQAATRRALLGDWGRVVRDPIDLLRLVFVAGSIWFAVNGDIHGMSNLLVATVGVLGARALDLPRLYDLGFCVAMIFTGWGEALGLYDEISWYDNLVHFCVPLLSAQVAYIALARVEVLPDLRDRIGTHRDAGIFVVTFALGVAIGGLWEILEWSSDSIFGSNLQLSNGDTVGDLIADSSGSAVGAALFVCWGRFGWGSVRRIPGENRYEDTDA
jgi:hypothetical protein